MKIVPNRDRHIPYFVRATLFEQLWRRSDLFVGKWEGDPKQGWFKYDESKGSYGKKIQAFIVADVSIENFETMPAIYFVNGRHRTRWLLQSGMPSIPVGIENADLDKATKLGLVLSKVTESDQLLLPNPLLKPTP